MKKLILIGLLGFGLMNPMATDCLLSVQRKWCATVLASISTVLFGVQSIIKAQDYFKHKRQIQVVDKAANEFPKIKNYIGLLSQDTSPGYISQVDGVYTSFKESNQLGIQASEYSELHRSWDNILATYQMSEYPKKNFPAEPSDKLTEVRLKYINTLKEAADNVVKGRPETVAQLRRIKEASLINAGLSALGAVASGAVCYMVCKSPRLIQSLI